MRAIEVEQQRGRSAGGFQAGETVDGFLAHLARTDPDDVPLNAEDLLDAWPVQVVVEGGGGGQAALFETAVRCADRLGLAEGGGDGGAVNTVAMSCSNWGWLPLAIIR